MRSGERRKAHQRRKHHFRWNILGDKGESCIVPALHNLEALLDRENESEWAMMPACLVGRYLVGDEVCTLAGTALILGLFLCIQQGIQTCIEEKKCLDDNQDDMKTQEYERKAT